MRLNLRFADASDEKIAQIMARTKTNYIAMLQALVNFVLNGPALVEYGKEFKASDIPLAGSQIVKLAEYGIVKLVRTEKVSIKIYENEFEIKYKKVDAGVYALNRSVERIYSIMNMIKKEKRRYLINEIDDSYARIARLRRELVELMKLGD